jgi:alpha-ketoglutarate-dependent taurine dioxygenase
MEIVLDQFKQAQPTAHILNVYINPAQGIEAAAEALDTALRKSAVLHIKGGNIEGQFLDFWSAVAGRIGRIDHRGENPTTLERVPAVWNDIRYDPALAATYRHSKTAQPLHTDAAYNDTPPPIGFFFCQAQARAGGNTLFLDADVLCEILQDEAPALFNQLRTVPVAFGKGAAPGQVVPIIDKDEWGYVLNWNFYRVLPGQSSEVTALCQNFFTWLDARFIQRRALSSLRLAPGECMVFHDLRCLHGRDAYEAEVADERWIWNLNLHWNGHIENHGVTRA